MRYPEYLKENGTIGFIAPSFGCASLEPYHSRFLSALDFFQSKGYKTICGPNVFLDDGIGKSTSPLKCGDEINEFFCSNDSNIIISVGGGETMCEDLDFVDFDALSKAEPKWFLGYSDNTNLTFTLSTICDTAAVYGPCASSFGMSPVHPYLQDTLDFLCGKKTEFSNYDKWEIESKSCEETPLATLNATEPFILSIYQHENLFSQENCSGLSLEFSGRLLGGCLDILSVLCGTKYDKVNEFNKRYSDEGVIWFLESCDLNSVSVIRSLWQLENAGWFKNAKGFLIGRPMHYSENVFGITCQEAFIRMLKKHNVPIILNIDLGHLPPQMPIVSGALGTVKVNGNSLSIRYN